MIAFRNLIRDLVPLLARRHRVDELPMPRGDSANPAGEVRCQIREISPGQLGKFKQLPLIVDVREEEEFFAGHIKGARNVAGSSLMGTVSGIVPDRSSPILVYCSAGNRGAMAADVLQKMGYLNVFSLKGGLSGWLEAGGMVETE